MHYEMTSLIGGREVDGKGHCKPSALLDHLQVAATVAAEVGGFGRSLVERYGAFWMLARSWHRLARPLQCGEALTVRTWHRGSRTALMYRDYDLYVDGQWVGEGVSGWVLAGVDSRKLLRLAEIQELAGTDGGELCKTMQLNKLKLPPQLEEAGRRTFYYSDTDINGHVNNARYADLACDALEQLCVAPGLFLQEMQIGYQAECRAGETLSILRGQEGARQMIRGVDGDGKIRFEVSAIFGQDIH